MVFLQETQNSIATVIENLQLSQISVHLSVSKTAKVNSAMKICGYLFPLNISPYTHKDGVLQK